MRAGRWCGHACQCKGGTHHFLFPSNACRHPQEAESFFPPTARNTSIPPPHPARLPSGAPLPVTAGRITSANQITVVSGGGGGDGEGGSARVIVRRGSSPALPRPGPPRPLESLPDAHHPPGPPYAPPRAACGRHYHLCTPAGCRRAVPTWTAPAAPSPPHPSKDALLLSLSLSLSQTHAHTHMLT